MTRRWRLATEPQRTGDELGLFLGGLLDLTSLEGICLASTVPALIRSYEELEGGQGREVFFRPHRYRAPELLPVRGEVQLPGTGSTFTYVLHDVSQNGVAFEWPTGGPPFTVGEHLQDVVVRFDSYEAYRGEARVGSVRDVGGVTIVGISFEGLLLAVDEVLHLRSIKLFTESRASSLVPWRVPGHERFAGHVACAAMGPAAAIFTWIGVADPLRKRVAGKQRDGQRDHQNQCVSHEGFSTR